jgi:hypothetical protein
VADFFDDVDGFYNTTRTHSTVLKLIQQPRILTRLFKVGWNLYKNQDARGLNVLTAESKELSRASNSAARVPTTAILYLQTRAFIKSLNDAFLLGGQPKKRIDKVRVVLGSLDREDPFVGLSVTNNGETRVKHCVKYDLGDGWRLVTQQTEKTCTFLFAGDHDDTDRWLDSHRGQTIGVQDNRLVRIPGVGDATFVRREHFADHHSKLLADMLDADAMDHVLEGLPPSLVRKLSELDGSSKPEDLEVLLNAVMNSEKAELIRTVFVLLLAGNVDGAQRHVDLNRGNIATIAELDSEQIIHVEDGEEVRRLRVGSPEYIAWLRDFEKRSTWQDWFLFLHPEQEQVVNADYPGVSQLSGVSGSGKTCVVVRRAMRLAKQSSARVLVLTLNRSLSGLLRKLIDAACVDEAVRSRIEVTSFFELARTLLLTFEPESARQYEDVTWKLDEHVDEVFREYYRRWANNDDASMLLPIHKSLNARGVNGETYVREEFDWIRSAVSPNVRADYLEVERKGRKFPIPVERRRELLRGLHGWEKKMRAIGVVDYLGLTNALSKHMGRISPSYTNILVDEAQDFGTSELRIVRKLALLGPNDIFLCGDIAQTVLPKHRSLSEVGLSNVTRARIRQNYRNSREILAAAYDLLTRNLHEEMFESDDLEILDPRFANFNGPIPMALAAESLEEEVAYAQTYAATRLAQDARTVCVAFAGFSSRDVKSFAKHCGVYALDGAYDPSTDRLVFSDLEQTKGYEFDTLIIVGCCDGVLPARDALPEETFREACKLYVTMTRARRELILSFHDTASPWIRAVSGTIATDQWASAEVLDATLFRGVPEILPEIDPGTAAADIGSLAGLQYIYTVRALGLSPDAQDKLIDLVDGKGARTSIASGGRRLRWATIHDLALDLNSSRLYDTLVGPKVADELRANLASTGI